MIRHMKIQTSNILYGIMLCIALYVIYQIVHTEAFENYNDDTNRYLTEMLTQTGKLLNKHGITYWLDYGTCLGAYRDKDFIKHDTDIDISIFIDDYEYLKQIISDTSIIKMHSLKNVRQGKHICSLKLDSFDGKSTDNYVRANEKDDAYVDIYVVFFKPRLDTIQFKGHSYNIPANTDGYLRHIYGDTWHTPIKNGKHGSWPKDTLTVKDTQWFQENVLVDKIHMYNKNQV